MANGITLNPAIQTNFPGTFSVTSEGWIQGLFQDDPAVRNELAGGILDAGETLPMWGGIAISEFIPTPGNPSSAPAEQLGPTIKRATAEANITGFSVFNQAGSMLVSAQSRVPLSFVGGAVNFFRLGSGARIAVKCDPSLTSLETEIITTGVEWDYTNQLLIPHTSGTVIPVKVLAVNFGNSKTVSYDGTTGFANWSSTGNVAIILI